jgi:hypothetical protein
MTTLQCAMRNALPLGVAERMKVLPIVSMRPGRPTFQVCPPIIPFMRPVLFLHVFIRFSFMRWPFPTTGICRNIRGSFETTLTINGSAIYMPPAFHQSLVD